MININGTDINWEFKNDSFSKTQKQLGCPHLEFKSETPNAITETGYKSHFFNGEELEKYNSIKDFINALIPEFKKDMPEKMDHVKSKQEALIPSVDYNHPNPKLDLFVKKTRGELSNNEYNTLIEEVKSKDKPQEQRTLVGEV